MCQNSERHTREREIERERGGVKEREGEEKERGREREREGGGEEKEREGETDGVREMRH